MSGTSEKLKPEELLMNVLADAGRIEKIVILVDSTDGFIEQWSNVDFVTRAGMLHTATVRNDKRIADMVDTDKD